MEIERKFLLLGLPDIQEEKHVRIEQGYLSINPEVRIRSYEVIAGKDKGHVDYLLTIKGDGDLSREEVETYIDKDSFDRIAKLIGNPLIEKDYRKYRLGDHILQCSVVDPGTKDEFIYAEIEFPTEEEAKAYELPLNGAVDVTYDKSYKMKNYWTRTRVERKTTKERYKEFMETRAKLCAFCGKCPFPGIVDAKCEVTQLYRRMKENITKE